ncbi:protein kinase domain-containing protein [Sarocladium implicatum]|nr:protein kinase domain-containing protein [Sarocladium implicatum]
MRIIDSYEVLKVSPNGEREIFAKFVFVEKDVLYIGRSADRHLQPTRSDQLDSYEKLETEGRGPPLEPRWTVAEPGQHRFEKKPDLGDFEYSGLEENMAHEIDMCEVVRKHPHENLATYYGCVVTGEKKVSGLLFEKYDRSLRDMVNSEGLNNTHFIASGRTQVRPEMRNWLERLREAVKHLHSLGYVHNDITPANIMIDDEGSRPVLIDFGSMCHVGESLARVGRTMEWHDPSVTHAAEQNDLDALTEIETWMFGLQSDLKFHGIGRHF